MDRPNLLQLSLKSHLQSNPYLLLPYRSRRQPCPHNSALCPILHNSNSSSTLFSFIGIWHLFRFAPPIGNYVQGTVTDLDYLRSGVWMDWAAILYFGPTVLMIILLQLWSDALYTTYALLPLVAIYALWFFLLAVESQPYS